MGPKTHEGVNAHERNHAGPLHVESLVQCITLSLVKLRHRATPELLQHTISSTMPASDVVQWRTAQDGGGEDWSKKCAGVDVNQAQTFHICASFGNLSGPEQAGHLEAVSTTEKARVAALAFLSSFSERRAACLEKCLLADIHFVHRQRYYEEFRASGEKYYGGAHGFYGYQYRLVCVGHDDLLRWRRGCHQPGRVRMGREEEAGCLRC